jgi:hypothetical protein
VVNSSVSASSRGFLLTSGAHEVKKRLLPTSFDGSLVLLPTTASVVASFSFPLDNFYAVNVLSEKQSLVALLSSIVGLAGIFSFFGNLLGLVDALSTMRLRSRGETCASARETRPPEVVEQDIHVNNPMLAGEVAQTHRPANQPTSNVWYKVVEGDLTWFESVDTDETAWDLPPGAILKGA